MFLTNFVSKSTNKILELKRDYFICNYWSCIQKREENMLSKNYVYRIKAYIRSLFKYYTEKSVSRNSTT